jgi:branched-chain amino acid transport system substrate-binding protein
MFPLLFRARHAVALLALSLISPWASAQDTVKIAHFDPLSGPFALVGQSIDRLYRFAVDDLNARGGVLGGRKLEVVSFDTKGSPQEAVLLLKSVIDQKIRFVAIGSGSHIAHAVVDTLNKHNARNPDQAVLVLNIAAQDPALTNEKCSWWHFRWEGSTDMRVNLLTDHIAKQKTAAKVYLINQDYAFGQSIAKAAREMLARKRAEVQIVGDDLHPLGKVKDFAPYVSKIKAAGADAVLTGNWGPDLSLLIKAAKDAGLDAVFYTLNANNAGVPASIGAAGEGRIRQVSTWHANAAENRLEKAAADYRKRYNEDFWLNLPKLQTDMLARAIDVAGAAEPLRVGRALHGMRFSGDTGEVLMRAEDHQLIAPNYIATFTRAGGAVKFDAEGTGLGWKTDARIDAKDVALPTACRMEEPR